MSEHRVDEQFKDVIARMEQMDMRGDCIEDKVEIRHFPPPL